MKAKKTKKTVFMVYKEIEITHPIDLDESDLFLIADDLSSHSGRYGSLDLSGIDWNTHYKRIGIKA